MINKSITYKIRQKMYIFNQKIVHDILDKWRFIIIFTNAGNNLLGKKFKLCFCIQNFLTKNLNFDQKKTHQFAKFVFF
jgi:hypothetical protein